MNKFRDGLLKFASLAILAAPIVGVGQGVLKNQRQQLDEVSQRVSAADPLFKAMVKRGFRS